MVNLLPLQVGFRMLPQRAWVCVLLSAIRVGTSIGFLCDMKKNGSIAGEQLVSMQKWWMFTTTYAIWKRHTINLLQASLFIHTGSYLIKVCLLVFGAIRPIWEGFFASWILAKVWFLSRMCSEVNLEAFQLRKGLGTTRILHWKRKLRLRICTFSWVNNLWLCVEQLCTFLFLDLCGGWSIGSSQGTDECGTCPTVHRIDLWLAPCFSVGLLHVKL